MDRAFALREAVFTVEQGFPQEEDRDAQDETALHVLGLDDAGEVCCTARLFSTQPGVWHAGRIAVRADARGRAAADGRDRAQGARARRPDAGARRAGG